MHLPAENRSWRLVIERTLEDITSRANMHTWRRVNKQTRRCRYPDKSQCAHLEKERKAYPEESRRAHPSFGDDKCTEHRADIMCTYKCTDLEHDQCGCMRTGEMMIRSSELDLCRSRANMATEAVPNETENDLRTYEIVYRTPPSNSYRTIS